MEEMRNKLGIEEFIQEILERVSKKIVTFEYIQNNSEFMDSLLEDMYDKYLYDDISITCLSDIIESFFYNYFMFRLK